MKVPADVRFDFYNPIQYKAVHPDLPALKCEQCNRAFKTPQMIDAFNHFCSFNCQRMWYFNLDNYEPITTS